MFSWTINSSGYFLKCMDTPSQLFPRNHLSHQSASLAAAHRVAPVARLMPTRLAPVLNFQKVREGPPPAPVYPPLPLPPQAQAPTHTTDCIALVQTAPKYGNHFCFKARAQLRALGTGLSTQDFRQRTMDFGVRTPAPDRVLRSRGSITMAAPSRNDQHFQLQQRNAGHYLLCRPHGLQTRLLISFPSLLVLKSLNYAQEEMEIYYINS